MENKVTSHVIKGLIIALVLITISVISQFMGYERASWVTWLSNIILVGGIIWSCIIYGRQINNKVTFGNLFAHGFKTTAVATVIVIVFTIIFLLIFPEIKEKAITMAREELEKKNNLSDDQVDTALGITEKFFMPIMIGSLMFLYLSLGAIASLIGAAVTKKTPSTPFANQV